ncbi:MAG: hypothetical protein ACAH95_13985, partial [Fimbriimonas sp.]
SIGGVGCIALALDWLIPGSEPTELQLRLASLSVWLACVGMIAVGIGIVQLINYGAWRPELVGSKWANKEAARQTLFTALQMFEKGDFVSEHLQFAYPERTRLADAKRQGRLTWIGIFFFCLFWIGMAVWAHIDEIRNPNRKTDLLGMLFVDAMIAFIVGGAVSLTFYSAARERRLLPYLQARVVIEGTRLFVRDGDRLHEARITKPAQSTVFSRSSNSLGLTIMIVEAGGKTYAFDPLSMIRETGVE